MRFEELTEGRVFEAGPREVTEAEIIEFARRYDPQPFHIDPAAARAGRWGGLIASGWMTCGIAMDLVVRHLLAGSESIGSPGVEQIEWTAPVRPGDRLRLTVTVVERRTASSKPIGIVRWRWELRNQGDEIVMRMIGTTFFGLA